MIWSRKDESRSGSEPPVHLATLLGVGCVVFLLSANLVWEHYFILSLPLLLATPWPGTRQPPADARQWIVGRTLLGLTLLGLMATSTYSLVRLPHEVYFPIVQGLAVLVLYGLALSRLWVRQGRSGI